MCDKVCSPKHAHTNPQVDSSFYVWPDVWLKSDLQTEYDTVMDMHDKTPHKDHASLTSTNL